MPCDAVFHQDCCDEVYSCDGEFFAHPRGRSEDGVYLGVELELEISPPTSYAAYFLNHSSREKVCEQTLKLLGKDFVACKEDGSLDHYRGVEIVSVPATLEFHKRKWRKFFKAGCAGLRAYPSCGMHVHVSRRPLGEEAVANMAVFMGEPCNRRFVQYVAGRSSKQYAKIHRKHKDCVKNGYCRERCSGDRYCLYSSQYLPHDTRFCNDRYEALNITSPTTVEFRIFASTTNWQRFVTNLEFCDALRRYASQAKTNGWRSFLKWLQERRGGYSSLWRFVSKYGSGNQVAAA